MAAVPTAEGAVAAKAKARRARSKLPVDENAPRKPPSSYFMFLRDNRPKITKELGSTHPKHVAAETAKRFKALTEEERKVLDKKVRKARKAYDLELQEYKQSSAYLEHQKALKALKAAKLTVEKDSKPSAPPAPAASPAKRPAPDPDAAPAVKRPAQDLAAKPASSASARQAEDSVSVNALRDVPTWELVAELARRYSPPAPSSAPPAPSAAQTSGSRRGRGAAAVGPVSEAPATAEAPAAAEAPATAEVSEVGFDLFLSRRSDRIMHDLGSLD
eukprot:CAMPEP_0170573766 /NCGR_PEP_ID=MMETSP0224-20130122/2939_1 /TAXON_ID=285029 /ORGANISM="Togula jolla, Strain CCCM 725" /LENGTH=273 /DNA_ID=CAMNT_0010896373 /DNA_START=21 /DNA_END=839 /DNA_ORIENTATION=-